MLELFIGLALAGGLLVVALVLPILSFVRASEARRTAAALRERVRELEAAVARLTGVAPPAAGTPPGPPPTAARAHAPLPAAVAHAVPRATPAVPAADPSPSPPPLPPPTAHRPQDDLEQRIGSRWLLYAGIAAVVLGMSYFVKFAFDNGWISERLRVLAGIASGLALVAAGLRFSSRGVPLFGQALAGGGILILYLSMYAALHFYALVAPGPAFALMAAVTAGAAWMSDRQRSQLLAVLALVGGFATPLLVGGDRDAQVVLFTYIGILVAGTASLAQRHRWPLLAAGSYLGTLLLVVAWFFESYDASEWLRTHLFLTLYAVMFALLLRALLVSGDRSPTTQFAIALLATAPLAYHVASLALLNAHPAAWLVYLVAASVVGLAVAERTRAAWLPMLVLLLVGLPAFAWLTELRLPGWYAAGVGTAIAIYVLHLVSQWDATPELEAGPDLNAAQATHVQLNGLLLPFTLYWFFEEHASAWSASVVTALAAWNAGLAIVARSRAPRMGLQFTALAATLTAAAIVVAFDGPAVAAGWAAEGVFLAWLAMRERSRVLGWGSVALVGIGALQLLALLTTPLPVSETPLINPRALATAMTIGLIGWLAWRMRADPEAGVRGGARDAAIVLANLLAVAWMSAEIHAFFTQRAVDFAAAGTPREAGLAEQFTLSVGWALYAVALIALGIRRQYAPARYFAITLFGITIAKVLLHDIAGLDRLYRMLTVLGVGLLLLVASYLYQRRVVASPGDAP